jgi:hypothetical protein
VINANTTTTSPIHKAGWVTVGNMIVAVLGAGRLGTPMTTSSILPGF